MAALLCEEDGCEVSVSCVSWFQIYTICVRFRKVCHCSVSLNSKLKMSASVLQPDGLMDSSTWETAIKWGIKSLFLVVVVFFALTHAHFQLHTLVVGVCLSRIVWLIVERNPYTSPRSSFWYKQFLLLYPRPCPCILGHFIKCYFFCVLAFQPHLKIKNWAPSRVPSVSTFVCRQRNQSFSYILKGVCLYLFY